MPCHPVSQFAREFFSDVKTRESCPRRERFSFPCTMDSPPKCSPKIPHKGVVCVQLIKTKISCLVVMFFASLQLVLRRWNQFWQLRDIITSCTAGSLREFLWKATRQERLDLRTLRDSSRVKLDKQTDENTPKEQGGGAKTRGYRVELVRRWHDRISVVVDATWFLSICSNKVDDKRSSL